MLGPDMVVNAHALRLIQTAGSDLNTVRKHRFVHAQCASTC